MKIKKLLTLIVGIAMVLGMSMTLTSCESDDYWYDGPGWDNGFYDRNLTGFWELVQVDSHAAMGYDKNYLFFDGRGYGTYFYWERGSRYEMPTYYDCQYSNSGTSDYQMNLQYGNGYPTTINYWFTNGGLTLWMQWREGGRVITYVYDRINGAPW